MNNYQGAKEQADRDNMVLNLSGMNTVLGPSNDPGVQGVVPSPNGVVAFWSPSPGVILYRNYPRKKIPKTQAAVEALVAIAKDEYELLKAASIVKTIWGKKTFLGLELDAISGEWTYDKAFSKIHYDPETDNITETGIGPLLEDFGKEFADYLWKIIYLTHLEMLRPFYQWAY